MVMDYISRTIFGFLIKNRVISIGTKYYPTNDMEREYVQMVNYTRTMLLEIETAHITTENIFNNVLSEVGTGNIPDNRKFHRNTTCRKQRERIRSFKQHNHGKRQIPLR